MRSTRAGGHDWRNSSVLCITALSVLCSHTLTSFLSPFHSSSNCRVHHAHTRISLSRARSSTHALSHTPRSANDHQHTITSYSFIFDIPGYIQLTSLEFDPASGIYCDLFTRDMLADVLGIPANHLPTLACLSGNDSTHSMMHHFHKVLPTLLGEKQEGGSKGKGKSKSGGGKGKERNVMVHVAQLLVKLGYEGDDR